MFATRQIFAKVGQAVLSLGLGLGLLGDATQNASANPRNGSMAHIDRVLVNRTDFYNPVLFNGHEVTEVRVTADGPVKLVVTDENGDVVGQEVGETCVVLVTPGTISYYVVSITNLDDSATTYLLEEF